MIPSLEVPPQYFYALAAGLPTTVTPGLRYRLATLSDEVTILGVLRAAVEDGVIVEDNAVTVEMAARRLRALGSVQGVTPVCDSGVGLALTQGFAAFESAPPLPEPADDIAPFWASVTATAALAAAHLELILAVVFELPDPRPLIAAAATMPAPFPPLTSVQNLDAGPWPGNPPEVTQADWLALFTAHPEVLPPIVGSGGSLEEQVGRFVGRLRSYFDVTSTAAGPTGTGPAAPPTIGRPAFDPLQLFLDAYRAAGHAGWDWGDGLDPADRDAAVGATGLSGKARAWLAGAVGAVDAVFGMTAGLGSTPQLRFSMAEALYARGFTSAGQVRALTRREFTDAMIGTPVHDDADTIWTTLEGGAGEPPDPGPFQPVNPGDLADCAPPCELSATGDLAYLRDLLELPAGGQTLGERVAQRRGPVGDLAATSANATVAMPAVDLVVECLEAITGTGVPAGAVHDTPVAGVAGHSLESLLAAVPVHSSPATPLTTPGAYARLSTDFSAPALPYSQEWDFNRRHLDALGVDRFTVMRAFRRDITEFVRDRDAEPAEFVRHVWRYPVRLPLALEFLCISRVEYDALLSGPPAPDLIAELYGFTPRARGWARDVRQLSVLLPRLGLDYCELYDLSRSGLIRIHVRRAGSRENATELPECEPCCLPDHVVFFDEGQDVAGLGRLAVLTRLWRKLSCRPGGGWTVEEMADAADVLGMFTGGGVDPDFVPQLAALEMLRQEPGFASATVTDLLDLWRDPSAPLDAGTAEAFVRRIAAAAGTRYGCRGRGPEFEKLLGRNLDPLSELGGFDPAQPAASWRARPTHTLRFVEQLGKIYAAPFGIGELIYLCTADAHLSGDDPYVLATPDEAELDPLQAPDDDQEHSLRQLRAALLRAEPDDEAARSYTWPRIREVLATELGRPPAGGPDPLHVLGAHLFPDVLEDAGEVVTAAERVFGVPLPGSPAAMWNSPDSPFRYAGEELTLAVPFSDDGVLTKLSRIRPLQAAERQAVRDLFHLPRLELAGVGYLFDDLDEASRRLLAEPDQELRWVWFRHRFALFHARCRVIADHLAGHVVAGAGPAGGTVPAEASAVAWRLLSTLAADENTADPLPWTRDDGIRPDVRWGPAPVGGAFAALAGLAGTGLLAEYRRLDDDAVVWRALQPTTDLIRPSANAWNVPVPTLLPSLDADLPGGQQRFARARNGILISGRDAEVLGGAEGYRITWTGALLVERDGRYEFWGDEPHAGEDRHAGEGRHWRVVLRRGQKTWVLLAHDWPEAEDCFTAAGLPLRRGAYDLRIELVRDRPGDDELDDQRPLRTGLRIEYRGPDTGGERTVVPTERLHQVAKSEALGSGADDDTVLGVPSRVLAATYVSTLRDIRRTYQRAFKAVLLAWRFGLSATVFDDYAQSELGYLLDHRDAMAGLAFYAGGAGWQPHRVDFDANLLPLLDTYHPPAVAVDDRVAPPVVRQQALFDLWERLFDHVLLRERAGAAPEDPVWLLYDEAAENQPDNPAQLLRHLGVDLNYADAVLHYDPGYEVTADDLTDERWTTRVWHADRTVRRMVAGFAFDDVSDARPDLWAAGEPGVAGGGNENLAAVVRSGLAAIPPRLDELRAIGDCLRRNARDALLAHLCALDRVPLPWPGAGAASTPADLSALLLIDVECGTGTSVTRVGEAIGAVTTYVGRARLGLEPPWRPDSEFLRRWDERYADCTTWGRWRRRSLYPENVIADVSRERDRASEAFRFLEDELRRATLTSPVPGGLEIWDDAGPPRHPGLVLLQDRDTARLRRLTPRQGLGLLGTPDADGPHSWLAPGPSPQVPDSDRGLLPAASGGVVPLWIEAAVRLGARFLRVPAAGVPAAAGNRPVPVDEYYFWLVDTAWFDEVEQVADWPGWHDDVTAAPMLLWPARPMVHLMWCRLHDGELQQPRRSVDGVPLADGTKPADADLSLLGRFGDSILLAVSGGAAEPGAVPPPDPGFRYDIAPDQAYPMPVVVPADAEPPPEAEAYPFFAYHDPGAPLFPLDPFSEAVTVAEALRARCSYEAALRWYSTTHDPATGDNRWCPAPPPDPDPIPSGRGRRGRLATELAHPVLAAGDRTLCCTGGEAGDDTARRRYVTLSYLETLLDWGDGERRCATAAGDARASMLYAEAARILGPAPVTACVDVNDARPVRVADFVARGTALNPWLTSLYERVADRQAVLRRDPGHPDGCCCGGCDGGCCPPSPYRFVHVLARAAELARQAAGFGAQLQAALEKGDAEHLATVRARHEHQIASLTLGVRREQWRDADWQVQSLRISQQIAQTNHTYYDLLITNGLGAGELDYQDLTTSSVASTTAATIHEAIGTVLGVIPDVYVGLTSFTHLPLGTKLAEVFQGVARIQQQVSGVLSGNAGLRSTQGGWDRRLADWQHQRAVLRLEIAASERQILAAERRRDVALRELNAAQRQAGNTTETIDLQRDKTTASHHFLWLQKETAALYRHLYDLAACAAEQAERAFNTERGFTARRFLPAEPWDDLRHGLLAGERLSLALHAMDAAYLTENEREFELTKHLSLRRLFPEAFLALKLTGSCVLELSEWLFDLDYPGHYLRRIKSVSLSIPSVVGPYTGVHCRLTLLASTTRVDGRLAGRRGACCDEDAECGCPDPCGPGECATCGTPCDPPGGCSCGYALIDCDTRAVRTLAARDAIATSSGLTDSGLFELTFRDERYLPFELAGVVSRWRVELPAENNDFDLDSISDVVMHLNYTARDAGPVLRDAAAAEARKHLPDDGVRVVDVRREMPQEWARFTGRDGFRRLELRLSRDMFAYAYGDRAATVRRLEIFVAAEGAYPSARREVEFQVQSWADRCDPDVDLTFTMAAGAPWCGFFHGLVDVTAGPIRSAEPRLLGVFDFEEEITDVERVFLVVHYELGPVDGSHR
jgi:hypothetical protein